jgi:hypothetical protein
MDEAFASGVPLRSETWWEIIPESFSCRPEKKQTFVAGGDRSVPPKNTPSHRLGGHGLERPPEDEAFRRRLGITIVAIISIEDGFMSLCAPFTSQLKHAKAHSGNADSLPGAVALASHLASS